MAHVTHSHHHLTLVSCLSLHIADNKVTYLDLKIQPYYALSLLDVFPTCGPDDRAQAISFT